MMEHTKEHTEGKNLPPWLAVRVQAEMRTVYAFQWVARITAGLISLLFLSLCMSEILVASHEIPTSPRAWITTFMCLAGSGIMTVILLHDDPLLMSRQKKHERALGRVMAGLTDQERMDVEGNVQVV